MSSRSHWISLIIRLEDPLPSPPDCVAVDRATAKIRHVQPHAVSEIVLFQVFVHVEEGDSGLNQGESSFNIHFENLVHVASKIESKATGLSRAGTTATNIPSDRERPDRYLELVAQTPGSLYVW